MIEVVGENSEAADLDAAFETLIKQIDPPKDPHKALRELRKADWQAGENVDDFFNRMKDLALEAKTTMTLACSIFVSQLPLNLQPPLREWLEGHGEIQTKEARELLVKVKTTLVEKNVPLDFGYREVGRIAVVHQEKEPGDAEEPTSIEGGRATEASDTRASVYVTSKETYKDAPRSKGAMGRRDGPTRKYPASQFPKKGRCFIYDSDRHFMAQCPERAKCGERGHELRYCPHTRSRRGVFQATTQHSVVHETAVVVSVKWNGIPINVMMETGADPSVVDRCTVQKMNILYSTKYSQVYGLGRTALAVCGTACVAIDVGDGRPLEHEIEVLDTNNRVVILGRRFLASFKNTTWENMRVRLGGCWKTSLAAARG